MTCRACYAETVDWLDLGPMPLANALGKPGDPPLPTYPLRVHRCPSCGTSQLADLLPPDRLFPPAYPYRSGVSAPWVAHCQALASTLAAQHPGGLVLDIGSNDGTLLAAGRDAFLRMRGCDPVPASADYPGFFPAATSHLPSHMFDAIVAQNVLGHVPDPMDFIKEATRLLGAEGTLVIEVPYVADLLTKGAFDTVYHEHAMYWSVGGLQALLDPHDLDIVALERLPEIHGGSLRVTAMHGRAPTVQGWSELDLMTPYPYTRFQARMTKRVAALWDAFAGTSGRIAAFGASAKGAVFAHVAGLGPDNLAYVLDETLPKHGHVTNYGVRIGPLDWLRHEPPELVWITPWNFAAEIRRKLQPFGVKTVTV